MAERFVKLYESTLDSSVWGYDYATRIVWVAMLMMADADGLVHASIPGIARRAGVTLEEAERAIKIFSEPDKHSRTSANDGRRVERRDRDYLILNYKEFRERYSSEERKKSKREWWSKNKDRYVTRARPESSSLDARNVSSFALDTTRHAEAEAEEEADPKNTEEAVRTTVLTGSVCLDNPVGLDQSVSGEAVGSSPPSQLLLIPDDHDHDHSHVTNLKDGYVWVDEVAQAKKRRARKALTDNLKQHGPGESTRHAKAREWVDAVWVAYPRRIGKGKAVEAAEKALQKGVLPPVEKAIDTINRFKCSDQWQKDGGQFIPHPATWINQERWNDEPTIAMATRMEEPAKTKFQLEHEQNLRNLFGEDWQRKSKQALSEILAPLNGMKKNDRD